MTIDGRDQFGNVLVEAEDSALTLVQFALGLRVLVTQLIQSRLAPLVLLRPFHDTRIGNRRE
jgi:hypothetical protein